MRKRELIILIVVLIFAVIFSLAVLSGLFSSPNTNQPSSAPRSSSQPNNLPRSRFSPTPTPPSPSPIVVSNRNELINQLPFQSDKFNIEYLGRADRYVITIKQDPYEQNLELAKKWFRDRGINPDTLEVYYNAFPEVQK